MDTGLIHIYYGDGKGKTTAAVGLTVRCAGRGGKVLFCQFLKEGETGELTILKKIPSVSILRGKGCEKFTFQMSPEEWETARRLQAELFRTTVCRCRDEGFDMLVLDEINIACRLGLLSSETVLSFLQTKPEKLEVVMTGRDPSAELIAAADYVSEIRKIRHPYDRGIQARTGIED
ncbi:MULTISPECIES: cob(I)yrinic acid a,c-diamide adenosyltransferase [Megasphaera]|uniref:Putative cob(I)yrinic acid a,c-diamide adenosyltransferase n=1 Tax=Megasphaera vaginalis (ex Srinivasan et al. 2021) TaxID=1111454 RepID=U7UTC9_9FIRM|nr:MULTISPECIES: cob(I)yrinic acid a,c-diamide adenosyltransferase [Megasphaera]ERT62581.1 putative cob(I)yrinic acid a,c-diamide adenosyltransferase [Megasphaera vaginalis (ex Srinivasan et al. 2021)]